MFSFAWPWMIALLAVPFVIRAIWSPKKIARPSNAILFPHIARLKAAFPNRSGEKRTDRLYIVLLSLLWLSLTCALMGPQLVDQYSAFQNDGYDLLLAVDLSGSMAALDYAKGIERTTRLDIVKSVVRDFVAKRQGDRVGLILFGTSAYLHVPLTLDTLSVGKMLDNVAIGEAGDTTAIGDAIAIAVLNLRDRPEKSRVLILLTDGGDNASTIPPLAAANLARQYGIRIYTIGVGNQGLVPIENDEGLTVLTQFDLDESLLGKIAKLTGGSYFRGTDTEALRKIYAQIDRLEKTQAGPRSYVIRRLLFRYPLGVALAMLLLLALLPVLRQVRREL